MSIISHITLGTNDKERAAKFYNAVLGAIGFSRLPKPPEKPLAYERGGCERFPLKPMPTEQPRVFQPLEVGQITQRLETEGSVQCSLLNLAKTASGRVPFQIVMTGATFVVFLATHMTSLFLCDRPELAATMGI